MTERVLMVCVGNICRSPIAEALWNDRLARQGLPPAAQSAGLSARLGEAMHPVSSRLLAEHGVAVPEPQGSRPLRTAMIKEAELVLVMERWQRAALEKSAPFARGRIFTLGHWLDVEIPDPMGEPEERFRLVFELIDQGISEWLSRLKIVMRG